MDEINRSRLILPCLAWILCFLVSLLVQPYQYSRLCTEHWSTNILHSETGFQVPLNLLTGSNHLIDSDLLKCISSMESDHYSFNSSQSSMSVAFKCVQYSAIVLHGLCTEYTNCPLSAETCQHLDSLNILRQPCITHHHELPFLRRRLSQRKRWCHRGKRGGRRLNSRPISIHVTPINQRVELHQNSRCANWSNLIPIKFASQHQHSSRARFAHWNARSIVNKTALICDFVISEKP
jgi:hypothetical protein